MMVSSRCGLVETIAAGAPISSSTRRTYFTALAGRSFQEVALNGIDGIALTKLDVLDGLPKLKICVGYKLNGEVLDYLPAGLKSQSALEPIYEEMDGWSESTAGAPISSSTRRTYLTALAGRSFHEVAPAVLSLQPSISS